MSKSIYEEALEMFREDGYTVYSKYLKGGELQ